MLRILTLNDEFILKLLNTLLLSVGVLNNKKRFEISKFNGKKVLKGCLPNEDVRVYPLTHVSFSKKKNLMIRTILVQIK